MRQVTHYIFTDATERDARTGVQDGDQCLLLSDRSQYSYDSNTSSWLPLGSFHIPVSTGDATPVDTNMASLADNFHTMQFEVWVQSVRDTGVNWRFRRVRFTAHRIGGVITLSAITDTAAATSSGTGSTVAYAFNVSGNFIRCNITGNVGENWSHTIRVESAEAGA